MFVYFSDKVVGHECANECYTHMTDCRLKCASQTECMIQCDLDLEKCTMACPCHENCKQGCSDCQSKYCKCSQDGAIEDKQQCLSRYEVKALQKFKEVHHEF